MAQESDKSLDDICEALDDLAIKNLELLEEKTSLSVQLEKLTRQGHIELAKARYIRGKESVGSLQIPSEENDIKSLFELETTYTDEEIPRFDVSRKTDEELPNPIKWFGVLVPQSLKSAQKHFQDALYLVVRLANVQAELASATRRSDSLKVLKKTVAA